MVFEQSFNDCACKKELDSIYSEVRYIKELQERIHTTLNEINSMQKINVFLIGALSFTLLTVILLVWYFSKT